MDNAPFGAHMFQLEPDDRLVFVGYNRKAEEMLGIDHSPLLGQTLEEAFPGNIGAENAAAYRRVARDGETWETDDFAYDANGVSGVFEISAHSIGQMRMILFFRDVTDKRRLEIAAQESGHFAQRLLDTTPDLVYVYDLVDNRNVYTNREVAELLGYTPQQILGFGSTLFEQILHPDDAARVAEHHTLMAVRAPGDDAVQEVDYRMKRADGRWRWLHSRDMPFARDESGTVTRILGSTEDVTDRLEGEQALRESQRMLTLALKGAKLGTTDCDVVTGIRCLDDAACRMLGIDLASFSGTADEVYAHVHPDDREMAETTHALAVARREPYSRRYRVIWADGSMHWVYSHGDVVTGDGGAVVRTIGVIEDVTEQEVARERLVSTGRALRALSWCNQTLVRAEDEQALLTDVCKVGVDQGGYRMAWVGYAEDDEARSVRPMAYAGHVDGFFDEVHYSWGDQDIEHSGLAGRAIRLKEPVIVRTMENDARYRLFAKEARVRGYASAAAFPLLDAERQVFGAITFVSGHYEAFDHDEMALLHELATDLAYGVEALRTKDMREKFEGDVLVANEHLRGLLRAVVEAMSRVVEARDPYTKGHEVRVARLARAIAAELGMRADDKEGIEVAGLVHDLGKVGIPAEILTKPGALTDIERQLVREHPASGYEILKDIDFTWPVAETVLEHHERLDGSGYPKGLKGDEILPGARVLAVADVVEAMASHRPYRPALSLEAALAEVGDTSRYDPEVAAACVRLFESGRFSLED
jgi:PAS domain S-box-containing protein/putative nucleotidyltransferase with HDIG domain